MIDKSIVYQKSAKGTEAIATRERSLGPKLRSMLILIDGKRTYAELEQIAGMLGDLQSLMGQLLDQAYIEPGHAAAPAPAPVSAPAPLAVSGPKLAEAKRHASHRLTALLGPNADDACLRIEAARNLQEFQSAVARAESVLRQYVSGHVADDFMQDIQAHTPGG